MQGRNLEKKNSICQIDTLSSQKAEKAAEFKQHSYTFRMTENIRPQCQLQLKCSKAIAKISKAADIGDLK